MPRRKTPKEIKQLERKVASYVGKKLRHYRKASRYSLVQVSRVTKIPITTLSEYERGKYPTPVDRLRRLATLYEAPLSEFYLNPDHPVAEDAEQIAREIEQWPQEDRELVMRAVLEYLKNLRDLSRS